MSLLEDVSLTIIYNRWPPAPPTPNLPARRKWIARRSRIVVNGKTIYLRGWELISPSGHCRWYGSRAEIAYYARAARMDEMKRVMLQALELIGVELIG
ncbi:hypothetical protein A7G45_00670 [Mycolicibacterium llatzerense]|nr:hypothetical protein [Mycolicibacterium llatzerense]